MTSLFPLYTVGYTGIHATIFLAAMHNFFDSQGGDVGKLIDTRYSPYSRNPAYMGHALKKALGSGYVQMGDKFGNVYYKQPELGIRLAQPDAYPLLANMLRQSPQIIMCGCKDHHTCHRSTVAQLILDHYGEDAGVIHLTITDIVKWSDRSQPAIQPSRPIQTPMTIHAPIQKSLF